MMRLLSRSLAGAALAFALAVTSSTAFAQSAAGPDEQDRLVGTWQLNLAKSTYSPGPPPTSETRTYTREGRDLRGQIQRAFADGRRERIEYTANFDREYPVLGTDAYDHIILKRVDAYTAEAVLTHAGRVFGNARRVIARDGMTMTVTFTRDEGAGRAVRNVAFYEKLPDAAPPQ